MGPLPALAAPNEWACRDRAGAQPDHRGFEDEGFTSRHPRRIGPEQQELPSDARCGTSCKPGEAFSRGSNGAAPHPPPRARRGHSPLISPPRPRSPASRRRRPAPSTARHQPQGDAPPAEAPARPRSLPLSPAQTAAAPRLCPPSSPSCVSLGLRGAASWAKRSGHRPSSSSSSSAAIGSGPSVSGPSSAGRTGDGGFTPGEDER